MGKIYLKADEFTYPSEEEKKEIYAHFPKISGFGFTYQKQGEMLFSGKFKFEDIHKWSNLFWWDQALINKCGKLQNAYVNTMANYSRGPGSERMMPVKESSLHHFQFDFYLETLYYYFFSISDIISQILNIYYDLGFEENNVKFFPVSKKVDNNISSIMKVFGNNVKDAYTIRNSFAHRFPVNATDNRASIRVEDNTKVYSTGTGHFITSKEMVDTINVAIKNLYEYIEQLKIYLVIPN